VLVPETAMDEPFLCSVRQIRVPWESFVVQRVPVPKHVHHSSHRQLRLGIATLLSLHLVERRRVFGLVGASPWTSRRLNGDALDVLLDDLKESAGEFQLCPGARSPLVESCCGPQRKRFGLVEQELLQ